MMPPPNNTKGTMSRITIDVLERQAEAMGLKVLESDIPGTTCGLYCDRLRTIWLADWLNDRQRLCTLCHELVHAKYRDLGCGTRFGAKCERRARRETALMLISPSEFAMAERTWGRRHLAYGGGVGRDHAGSRGLQADSQGWPVRETPMIHQPSIGGIILVETYCRRARRTSWKLYALSPVSPSVWPRSCC